MQRHWSPASRLWSKGSAPAVLGLKPGADLAAFTLALAAGAAPARHGNRAAIAAETTSTRIGRTNPLGEGASRLARGENMGAPPVWGTAGGIGGRKATASETGLHVGRALREVGSPWRASRGPRLQSPRAGRTLLPSKRIGEGERPVPCVRTVRASRKLPRGGLRGEILLRGRFPRRARRRPRLSRPGCLGA